jgi:CheY-like chemotaxis protein
MSGDLPSILIVEDEHLVAFSLQMLIDMSGRARVTGMADDLPSVLAAMATTTPDLALIDIQLARGASGYDVAEELRRRGVPAIFMTGNPPDRPRPELTLGCLSKPFSDDALFVAIEIGCALARGAGKPAGPLPRELSLY